MTLYFYRKDEIPYGCFSNFSNHGFYLDNVWWPTVEHFYQAQKFVGTPHAEAVRLATSAFQARQIGNDRNRPLHPDWDAVREAVMWRAIEQKFTHHEAVRALLLSTGDETIVEKSPYDAFWGCGAHGDGENRFGRMLMQLRAELRAQATQPALPQPSDTNDEGLDARPNLFLLLYSPV